MHILCDVDGVLANLHEAWLSLYNADYNDDLSLERWTGWDLHKFVKPECGKKIYEYLSKPDLYELISPVEGSQDGIEDLRIKGHDITIVTANAPGMADQKWRWLVRHGFIDDGFRSWPHDLIVCNAKWKIHGDIIIEDKAQTVIEWVTRHRKPAVILKYPYNEGPLADQPEEFFDYCTPASDWKEIVEACR